MAETLEMYAKELHKISEKMEKEDDVTYAAEAMSAVTNCIQNCRLDLLILIPIRDTQDKLNG